jgi:hypothetical protein
MPARAIAMPSSGPDSQRALADHRRMSAATAQQIKQGRLRIGLPDLRVNLDRDGRWTCFCEAEGP